MALSLLEEALPGEFAETIQEWKEAYPNSDWIGQFAHSLKKDCAGGYDCTGDYGGNPDDPRNRGRTRFFLAAENLALRRVDWLQVARMIVEHVRSQEKEPQYVPQPLIVNRLQGLTD